VPELPIRENMQSHVAASLQGKSCQRMLKRVSFLYQQRAESPLQTSKLKDEEHNKIQKN